MAPRGTVNINYTPSPTATEFHSDPSYFRALMGPVGGGKTVALVMEILRLALTQEADHWEFFYPRIAGRAVRPTRFLAVRSTYPQLKATLIKTFNEWPGKLGTLVYDSPIRWTAQVPLPDDTIAVIEVLFMALDGPRAAENLRSLEITAGAISEYAEIGQDVIEMLKSRIGRYPKTKRATDGDRDSARLFGPTRPCIIAESNPPSARSHWYRLFEVDRPKNHRIFKQPPAMLLNMESGEYEPNPDAENIANHALGFGYYQNLVDGNSPEYINVYVMNNYGTTFSGRPVFPLFNPANHVLGGGMDRSMDDVFKPDRRPIVIGMDFGLNPAAVFGQDNLLGGITIYDELVAEGMLFEQFLNEMVIPLINTRYRGHPLLVVGDPAGTAQSALSKQNAYDMLRARGIAVVPALTNDITYRLESVNYFLQRTKMFALHPRCVTVREAMAGGYKFEKARGMDDVYKEVPEKNEFSHPADAVQYLCTYYYAQIRKAMKRVRRNAQLGQQGQQATKGFTYV